jgi:subtilisin family serine protease
MRRWLPATGLAAFLVGCAGETTGPTSPAGPREAADFQFSRYVVVFHDNTVNPAGVTTAVTNQYGLRADHVYLAALQGFTAVMSPAAAQNLARDPRVKFVEADQIYKTTTTQSPTPSWGLDRIDQTSLPLSNSYSFSQNGTGVHFYGIDTGMFFGHPDFGGRASAGFDAVVPTNGAADCNGHGTHTASTAAGSTYGVAKSMTLVAVRVLDCTGSGTTSGVIAGIDWVRQHAIKPAVANMSLGGGLSSALNTAVANAVAAGIVFTVSAGNSGASACNASPASTPTALTVAASDKTDARPSWSNFGTCVDLFAPGVGITAGYWPSGTAVLSGTSMSAPHVAGVAGLYLQKNPAATPAQVAAAITANATAGKVTNAGTGSPNKLLYMGFVAAPPVNQPPVAAFSSSCSGLACAFDGTGSSDDVGITSYAWTFGDNATGSGSKPSHTYAAAGTYTVTLTVTDGGGLKSSTSHTVTVTAQANQPPVAVASVSCPGSATCTFDGSGSTDDHGIVSYQWKDNIGTVMSNAAKFTMTFRETGLRNNWTLTVKDAGGLSNTTTFGFTILP